MNNFLSPQKIGIFDPYLDTIGGGERYCLSLAETLLEAGWQVDLFWPDESLKSKMIEKFNLNIDQVNFVDYNPQKLNLWQRKLFEKNYEVLFYVSDGSLPFMFGSKNFLHFQVPFKAELKKKLLNRFKLKTLRAIICNSLFTKKIIDTSLGVNSLLVYPPVDVKPIRPLEKENLILSVGRFSQLLQGKRQDVLIEVFKKMVKGKNLRDWRLVLAGGSEVGGREYLKKLKSAAKGYSVEITENPSFAELLRLYGQAKIFWTASGYGIDENLAPEKVEHFGMSTVEAMAAGCVVIVMAKGGQKEIVRENEDGFFWLEPDDLEEKTLMVIGEQKLWKKISEKAILKSQDFSKEKFSEEVKKLVLLK